MVQEPLFDQILCNMILGQALRLKNKARIKLRDACVLIGVIDEQGVLEENEIFVQVEHNYWAFDDGKLTKEEKSRLSKRQLHNLKFQQDMKNKKDRQVIAGPVLVTKNPCVHPGDVRKVQTLTYEKDPERFAKLSHLFNVIVFPSKGPRPLQNMMSGGDLDGDVYMCIWDEQIVNATRDEEIQEPARTDVKPATQINSDLNGIFDHLAHYMRNDTLGELSNLHVAMSDQSRLGPRDPDCIALAALISV